MASEGAGARYVQNRKDRPDRAGGLTPVGLTYGVISTECGTAGLFFRDYPLVRQPPVSASGHAPSHRNQCKRIPQTLKPSFYPGRRLQGRTFN